MTFIPNADAIRANKPKKRDTHTDRRIHGEISAAILNHQLPPATPLHEDALASAFGVSRTIIRKVLQRLSHEKLVELIPNKGAIVARPTIEEARQVFEARRTVEGALSRKLAPKISDAEISRVTAILEAEAIALQQGDRKKRLQLSGDFHREIANIAGNDVLRDFVHELISRTALIIALYESPGAVPCSCDEHREIVEAFAKRDAKLVTKLMESHLQHVEDQIELSDLPVRIDFKALFKST